jgi:hypothetical protein
MPHRCAISRIGMNESATFPPSRVANDAEDVITRSEGTRVRVMEHGQASATQVPWTDTGQRGGSLERSTISEHGKPSWPAGGRGKGVARGDS